MDFLNKLIDLQNHYEKVNSFHPNYLAGVDEEKIHVMEDFFDQVFSDDDVEIEDIGSKTMMQHTAYYEGVKVITLKNK